MRRTTLLLAAARPRSWRNARSSSSPEAASSTGCRTPRAWASSSTHRRIRASTCPARMLIPAAWARTRASVSRRARTRLEKKALFPAPGSPVTHAPHCAPRGASGESARRSTRFVTSSRPMKCRVFRAIRSSSAKRSSCCQVTCGRHGHASRRGKGRGTNSVKISPKGRQEIAARPVAGRWACEAGWLIVGCLACHRDLEWHGA